MKNIKVGTLVMANSKAASYIEQIIPYGFESFVFTYSGGKFGDIEPEKLAEQVMPILGKHKIEVSAISVFGNMLEHSETATHTCECFKRAIDCASLFGTDIVSGFTGREPDRPIPDNIPRFKEVWTPIVEYAASKKVRVAFENCNMGGNWRTGSWNIAINPDAWELIFDAVPMDNLGLQWEPCHQMVQLIEPLPQIREWGKKFFHIHGKDVTIRRDVFAKHGIMGGEPFCWHRTPGFGDSNWKDIITELRLIGYQGNIDIEGWHDPVYRGELEMTGQVAGLNYLKKCRGDSYVPNPV